MNCSLSSISNHTSGFDFGEIYDVYQHLNQTCSAESDIFFTGSRMLTLATCVLITQTSYSIWTGWTPYSISDIWARIVTWKLPLAQLVAQFPRPPLGFAVETLTMIHLLGDPIDSVTSMLVTFKKCDARVKEAKKACSDVEIEPQHPEYDRTWKALAIIMVSYDECGKPENGDAVCSDFKKMKHGSRFDEYQDVLEETAFALASDRSTKSLPIAFAETFFIGGWIIALLKAAASEPNPTNWVNVEAQSVAISAMYLWVTSAVLFGAIIGVSQTEESIPRILQRYEVDMPDVKEEGNEVLDNIGRRPSASYREEIGWCDKATNRAEHGGAYSWRPEKWKTASRGVDNSSSVLLLFSLVAIVAVGCSFVTAAVLSSQVPPKGISCRHVMEFMMFFFWLLSFALECVVERWMQKIFWVVFWKDMFFALSTIILVLVTQWGIMNSCACWSMWGLRGLHLPQLPEVEPELMYYIRHVAPWITFMAILFQLVFSAAVAWKYWDAVRVFIQRDDGMPNLGWKKKRTQVEQDVESKNGSR
ncbi:hypothetical protein BDV96DRAFT_643991 [Lophiotrema nucula]|uniref:Uncharacterized protein n=1 Tax=Lophiotrema nucula TaxID=690887 RepID=A0A6A5ZDM1_9PLEO|nr:hypothetical protein BDV96DRAFT_643991 [Lophiotrema nucula]